MSQDFFFNKQIFSTYSEIIFTNYQASKPYKTLLSLHRYFYSLLLLDNKELQLLLPFSSGSYDAINTSLH